MAVGGIFVTLRALTSKFNSDMSKAQAAVNRFRTSTVNMQRQLKKVGKQMTRVGKQMSASLTLPIVAAGGLAVKTFADFEQSMAKVKAVSGATGAEFKKLESLAKDLGESTRFTAAQVAELELNYSKLGFVPAEIEKITKPTLDLALATGEDLANSAEVAGSTLRGLGLTAADMPRVVDVMAKSFSSSALDLESFREAMKLVAPTAVATGRDMETVTAQLGVLANNGIKGSIAGTQLNRVFLELNKQGISLEDAMDKVANSTNGLATATGLVKDRGAKALLILTKQRKELGPLEKKLRDAEGAAAGMATIMDDTLQGALLKVQSAVEGAAIELGQTLAPTIKKAGEFIAEMAQKFSALSPKVKKNIAIVAGLVAAVGPLLVVFGVMASTVIPALISGFVLLISPIGLIVGALAAIVGVAVGVFNHLNRIKTAQESLTDAMEEAQNSVAGEVSEIDKLLTIAKSEILSRERRQAAVDKLNSIMPELNENITLEGINSEKTAKLILKHKDSILKLAQARAIENRIEQIAAERLELVTSKGESALTGVDNFLIGTLNAVGGLVRFGDALSGSVLQEKRLEEQTKALKEEEEGLFFALGKLEKQSESLTEVDKERLILEERAIAIGLERTATLDQIIAKELELKNARKKVIGAEDTIGGKVDEGPILPKKAKAVAGEDIIPLTIQLRRAREEAALFSKAFTEDNTQSLQRQQDAIKSFIDESLKANGEITPEIKEQIALYDELGKKIEENGDKAVAIAEQARMIKDTIAGIFTGLGEAIGEALVSGDPVEAFKGFIKEILTIVKGFGTLLIAIGTGLTASLFGIIEGPKTIAAGIALIAAATAGTALLAQGGLIFGETLAVVGEGRGTTRTNPEVVAPLDKLQGFMGDGGRGGKQVIEFKLTGETLRATINKNMENRSFMTPRE